VYAVWYVAVILTCYSAADTQQGVAAVVRCSLDVSLFARGLHCRRLLLHWHQYVCIHGSRGTNILSLYSPIGIVTLQSNKRNMKYVRLPEQTKAQQSWPQETDGHTQT